MIQRDPLRGPRGVVYGALFSLALWLVAVGVWAVLWILR